MILDKIAQKTQWSKIDKQDRFRLRCGNDSCSLSCANIANGRLSLTSVHGNERHTYQLTSKDMLFLTLDYLKYLNSKDLETFIKLFNKVSDDYTLSVDKDFIE